MNLRCKFGFPEGERETRGRAKEAWRSGLEVCRGCNDEARSTRGRCAAAATQTPGPTPAAEISLPEPPSLVTPKI